MNDTVPASGNPAGMHLPPGQRRVAMLVRYDGTDFCGWQRQPNGRTVQEVLENALSKLNSDSPVSVTGAGRTDSGVHARGQVAHAQVHARYDDAHIQNALARMLPRDVAVIRLKTVQPDFHARFMALERCYQYRIISEPDPFLRRYSWHLPGYKLDPDMLHRAARIILGAHDFTALSKHNPDTPGTVCNVRQAAWDCTGNGLEFTVCADRFLYGMVRLLVGLQIDIARGKRPLDDVGALLAHTARDRQSQAAPACGLTLTRVEYPYDIWE